MDDFFFQILPGEQSWWQLDCNPLITSEGPAVTIVSWSLNSTGNVIVDKTTGGAHSSSINNNVISFWASAVNSEVGDTSWLDVTLITSSGEIIPTNSIAFYTVSKRTSGGPQVPVPVVVTNISCTPPVFLRSFDASIHGLRTVTCLGDGYTISLEWYKEYLKPSNWDLVYNLYWSTDQYDIFSEGVKFVVKNTLSAEVHNLFKPGSVYYFAVRGSGHEPGTLLFDQLPGNESGFRMYSEAALKNDITAEQTYIPLDDASLFPPSGIVIIGAELIGYSGVDLVDGYLLNASRGLYGYEARIHNTNGYDGYRTYDNIFVSIWKGWEASNTAVGMTTIKFTEQYARTNTDGFRERVDIISGGGNLAVVDAANAGFPIYDQTGWDRTFLPDYLSGKCVGTYFGGEWGCSDGYECDNNIRGLSIQEHMNMREEYLLQNTGERVMLFKRTWSGKQSKHYDSMRENTSYRGLDTYGTSQVVGYEPFYNPRESDGKILVRFGPTREEFKRDDAGIENTYIPNCWTLVIPSIKDGDFIIRFNQDGTEEWRYEILNVERNRSFLQETGAQKFTAIRVRKTDPICQVPAFLDTSMFPSEILTSISGVPGPGGIPLHAHRVIRSEKTTSLNQINQLTSITQGHSHPIVSGKIVTELNHTHIIILP
jgi:hypothetical protein